MAYYHNKKVSLNQPHRASGKDAVRHKSLSTPNCPVPTFAKHTLTQKTGVVYVKDGTRVKKVLFGDPK